MYYNVLIRSSSIKQIFYRDEDDTIEMMAVENISNTIRNDLNRLYSIWKEMGLCESTRSLYCNEVHKHIKVCLLKYKFLFNSCGISSLRSLEQRGR